MKIRTLLSWLAGVIPAALIALLPSGFARAADFPNGPIKWIIPYPSGGSYDALSRGLAPILSKQFGVPVVVNIIPGPDGYNQLINAKPDGQTIGMSEPLSVYATAMLSKPKYNVEDLTWLGRVNASGNLIVASKKSGITSFEQLKNHKGPVRGGAFGVTTPILQQILLADAVKFQLAAVNFRTIGEMIIGTVRGDVDISTLGVAPWLKHIEAGNVVPILIWNNERDPLLPNVPCLADLGLSELTVVPEPSRCRGAAQSAEGCLGKDRGRVPQGDLGRRRGQGLPGEGEVRDQSDVGPGIPRRHYQTQAIVEQG